MKLVDIFTAKRLVNIKSIAFSLLFIVLSLAIPFIGSAQVLVSEVAWMGTDDDANNEWIELYNLSSTATDLAGWTLSDGASIAISLTGILLPHRTGVLERTDDTTLPGTALLIYTGALSNSGGTLTLKDAGGTTADQVFGGTDWVDIGGSNVVPKKTPQRTRTGSWVTGTPTPGADNVQVSTPVATTVSETSTSGTAVSSTRTSSGSSTGVKKATAKIEKDPFLELTFEAPNVVYVNQEIEFEAMPRGIGKTLMNSLSYTWNFGDTYTASTKKTKHIFSYPGEYIVVSEARYANQKAQVRHEVTVLPVSFTIKKTNQ